MGTDLSTREQDLLADALERATHALSRRERRGELVVGGLFLLAVVALWLAFPPSLAAGELGAGALCLVVLALALRVQFDTASGITVPSQLAFVPLLFTVPPALVPLTVAAAWAVSRIPELVSGELRPSRLVAVLGNSWFAVGPACVLAISGVETAAEASAAILVTALVAQFAGDAALSLVREAIIHGSSPREQLSEWWVYAVDAALAPVGLLVAREAEHTPWAVLGVVPLLGVFAFFARERHARVEGLVELNNAYRGTALVLADVVEADDGYTAEHCRGVVELALAVADRLGLDAERRRNLEFAALLHDVGKVAIPKEIINKRGKLDPMEWHVVKTHTTEGQAMLDKVGGFMARVGLIIRSHHERWDGGGYPDGLVGANIPLEARIVACCDTWSAMTTTRSYRPALSDAAAAEELRRSAGTQLDPLVVGALLDVLGLGDAARDERRSGGGEVAAERHAA